jgi:hypothetical protein
MKDLEVRDEQLIGEAWSPLDDRWHDFKLDLNDGSAEGGSYPLSLKE